MVHLIDYLKIASKLNEIILYSSVGGIFLLWMWWTILSDDEKIKKTFFVFSSLIVFSIGFFPINIYYENFGYSKYKKQARKANVNNISNLKRNAKIVEKEIENNSSIKNKKLYANRILNKFYLEGKFETPLENQIMQKLKKWKNYFI